MKQMGFYIDTATCIGCKTCELACKDRNNLPVGVRLRKVCEYGGGGWVMKDGFPVPNKVFTYFIPASCMHCEKPACLDVCPSEAISKNKDTGAVTIDNSKCIGCGSCLEVCPYKAPSFNEKEEKMYKCDMCTDRLAEGKNPECVDACLQRCIKFGEINELRKQYGNNDSIAPLPSGDATKPSIVIKPHRYAEKSGSKSGRVRNVTELK